MRNSKFLLTSLLAAATMSASAYAEEVALTNGQQTTLTVGSGVAGAGNTYTYTAPEEGTTDNGGWLWLGDLQATGNVALGSAESNMALSGSGLVVLGYQGGNGGVTYNFDFTNTDASAFSGKFAVVNDWNNSTVAKLSGTGWGNVEYVFAGVSREQNWVTKRMYGNTSRGYDTLALQGETTLAGITGTSKGYSPEAANNAVAAGIGNINLREAVTVATSGTVLTLAGAGTYEFYGKVGTASAKVGIAKTGAGTQVLGGTLYLDAVTVSEGTLDLSGANVTLASTITNSATVKVSSDTIFALDGLTASDGVYSLVSGGTVTNTAGDASFSLGGVTIASSRVSTSTGSGYTVTFSNYGDLVWAGTTDAVWSIADSDKNWTSATAGTGSIAFANGDSVTFNTENASVTVSGTVNPAALTVSAATTFTGTNATISVAKDSLTISGDATLGIGSGVTLDLGSGGGTIGSSASPLALSGEGTVTYSFTSMSEWGGGTGSGIFIADSFAGTIDYSGCLNWSDGTGSGLSIGDAARLRLSANAGQTDAAIWGNSSGTIKNALEFGSDYSINLAGGSLTLEGSVTAENCTLTVTGSNTLTLSSTATIGNATLTGGRLSIGADANANVSGTVEMGTATLDGGTAGITVGTLKYGYNTGRAAVNTATIQGKVNVTGNVQQTSTGQTDNEKISLAAGAEMTVGGTFGTTAANAYDTNQVSVVLNIGDNASLTSANIANANKLTVTLGANATLSATTALTLNAAWGNKTHSFTGAGADSSKVLATALALKHNVSSGNTDPTTLSLSSLRLEVGAGGITVADDGKSKLALTNTTLGVLDGATGWSSSVATTLSGDNSADVDAGKSITLEGAISDASGATGALKKTGAGKLTLSGENTYTGGTVIEAGTVVAAHASALGTTKGVEVKSGATLNLGASAVTVAGLSGAGTVGLADGRDSSTLTVNGGGVFTGTLNGGLNSLALVFDANGQTLELNSNFGNSLSSVEVKAGTVKTGNALGLGYSANVTVQSLGRLEFTTSNQPKDSGLTLVDGGITFKNGASFVVDVTGAATDVALSIITSSVIKFYNGSEDVSLISDNLDQFVNNFVTLKGWNGLADWAYDGLALSVTLTIPEPSVFGLLAGLGALALAGTRRRRKKA